MQIAVVLVVVVVVVVEVAITVVTVAGKRVLAVVAVTVVRVELGVEVAAQKQAPTMARTKQSSLLVHLILQSECLRDIVHSVCPKKFHDLLFTQHAVPIGVQFAEEGRNLPILDLDFGPDRASQPGSVGRDVVSLDSYLSSHSPPPIPA